MSRTFTMVVLGTALGFLVTSSVLAADKPPTKKPPSAAADDPFAPGSGKPPRHKTVAKERLAPKKRPTTKDRPTAKERSRQPAVQPLPPGGNDAVIEQALTQPTQIEDTDSPLSNVLDYLKDYHSQLVGHRFEIQLDAKALKDAGITPDPLVTMNLRGISLRSALDLMLRQLNLTWTVHDEVLLVTTPEKAENLLTTRLFDVADLVVCRDSKSKLWNDYDQLIDLIKSSVLPTTWDDVGGPSSIAPAEIGTVRALVVSSTTPVQCEIADLLAKIRALAKKTPDLGPPERDKTPGVVGRGMGTMSAGTMSAGGASSAQGAKPAGILILDDCDDQYKGKEKYKDNLTLLDPTGKQVFRVSGFNNCESIGSSRMVASDSARKCIWVIENVAHRIRRFDLAGNETLTIPGVHGSAIAVDPVTGNVWALANGGSIETGKTVVYDDKGRKVASYDISGWDIVYDQRAKAFWIAERKLTKITAVKGEVVCSVDVSPWCASSVDIDPRSGAAWVAVRGHPEVAGSSNRLLKFDAVGNKLVAIDLGQKSPFRVSVDPRDGSVWVAHFRKSVERFSTDGKSQAEHTVEALAVQVDPAGVYAWVVTPMEVQKITPKGNVIKRVNHAGKTSQAWIGSLE